MYMSDKRKCPGCGGVHENEGADMTLEERLEGLHSKFQEVQSGKPDLKVVEK